MTSSRVANGNQRRRAAEARQEVVMTLEMNRGKRGMNVRLLRFL